MLMLGDCIERMKTLPDCSVDAVVTDPPYGLAFMGKKWDYDVPAVEVWAECLRVLKPGGHLLAFAGTRTQHRMAVRIEDAGFEIRDMIAWVYGSGFPKSLDVSKAIDKAAGAEREVTKRHIQCATRPDEHAGASAHITMPNSWNITAPATPAARQWQGWGTALKPALEPITVARKPLIGTVAENVLQWGTGGINVDGCRVGTDENLGRPLSARPEASSVNAYNWSTRPNPQAGQFLDNTRGLGRWPANLIHDGSEEPTSLLGDAARFFYCAKASKADRDEGCEGLPRVVRACGPEGHTKNATAKTGELQRLPRCNHHPTVKPTALMRYLCRLVTPPDGIVLDPFMGSGSTGKGAILEGFRFIGIEREAEYMQIAEARIRHATEKAINESQTPSQLELEVANA